MTLTSPENFASGPPLPPKAQRLAEILLARARDGECVISQAELCRLTGWDRTTVWRYLKELRKRGIIGWDRRKRLPNRYYFVDVNLLQRDFSPIPQELAALVSRGQNVLILGREGSGKTFQLNLISQDGLAESRLKLSVTRGTQREVLLSLVDQLASLGLLSEETLSAPLSRLSAKELGNLVLSTLAQAESSFLLLLDDLDLMPPSLQQVLRRLVSLYNVQIVATARDEKKLRDFVDHFVVFELPPLSREETERWVESFLGSRRIPVLGGEKGRKKLAKLIHQRTGGNPRKIQALLKKIEAQGYVDRKLLREELHVGGRLQFSDMTWLIVLTAALALAVRYLGLGLHDRTVYILGGFAYAVGFLLRWFSYRWRQK